MNLSIIIRGFCYVSLAVLTSLYAVNGNITTHEVIGTIMAGIIALRSFMDQSIGSQQLNNNNFTPQSEVQYD